MALDSGRTAIDWDNCIDWTNEINVARSLRNWLIAFDLQNVYNR
jgi:hypothetical protein